MAEKEEVRKTAKEIMTLSFRVYLSAVVAVLFLLPSAASAATLSLSPVQTTVGVGEVVTETVFVSSADQAMNAISGTVSFPNNLLQVVSVSRASSVLSLWVQEPTFSNADGTISFSGIVPNPGYTGNRGQVFSIQFRGKQTGTGTVVFSSSSQVLANDGNGTDILSNTSSATVTVSSGAPSTPAPTPSVIETVTITSPTHPDQAKWYSSTEAELRWTNPANATQVRIGYDKFPQGQPTVLYNTSVSSKSLILAEGVWYFHVQERTASGWGPTSTFRLQIDITPPNPIHIQFPNGSKSSDPQPLAVFNTTDNLSGIDYYVLTISGGTPVQVPSASVTSSPYPLPVQGPGPGDIEVTAYDKAGNSVTGKANFTVIGLNPPKLNEIKDISIGQTLQISGTTYPNAQVEIFLKNKNGQSSSQVSQADMNGAFRVLWKDALDIGMYAVTAQSTDSTGAKSTYSPEVTFQVKESTLSTLGQLSIGYFSFIFLILCVLAVLLFTIRWLWHRYRLFHKKLNSKLGHTHTLLHEQFTGLKDAVAEEVAALERVRSKRDLTVEEERFINRFQKMLDRAEEVIEEEVDRVAK